MKKPSRPTHWPAGLEGGCHRARVVTMREGSRKTPTSARSHSRGIDRRRVNTHRRRLAELLRSQQYSDPRLGQERMNRSTPEGTVRVMVKTTTHPTPVCGGQFWVQGQTNAHSSRQKSVEAVAPPIHTHRRQEHCPKWQERPLRMQTNHVSGSLRRCMQPQEHTQGVQSMHPRTPVMAYLAPIRTD